MNTSVKDFFDTDYVDQSSYDNLRKIASVVDGQKNAARKVLYTILEKNIKDELKVKQLGEKASEFAEYLHGNMDPVIVNLAQNFAGTNNIPLLVREGNFGTRFSQGASASRYIYTHGSPEFFKYFNKEDNDILVGQTFEGAKIEPRFYVPDLPMILVNGSEGVSFGFAQKILSRNPKKLAKAIEHRLENKTVDKRLMYPYFEGFSGPVKQGDNDAQWLIYGVIKRLGVNRIQISELPVGYDLKGYLDVLDSLEEKKIIQSYVDQSENDNFLFEVTMLSKTLRELTDEEILSQLKLIKKVTENYTVIDENNKIKVFDNSLDLLDHYIKVKLEYLGKRKAHQLATIQQSIDIDQSKYLFIQSIVENKLVINKRKKVDIEKDLSGLKNIIKVDDKYDYLLSMNILSLTEERMAVLRANVEKNKQALSELQKTTINGMWQSVLSGV